MPPLPSSPVPHHPPAVLAGCWIAPQLWSKSAARLAIAALLIANLLMPALPVSYNKVRLISPLPIESIRLLR